MGERQREHRGDAELSGASRNKEAAPLKREPSKGPKPTQKEERPPSVAKSSRTEAAKQIWRK